MHTATVKSSTIANLAANKLNKSSQRFCPLPKSMRNTGRLKTLVWLPQWSVFLPHSRLGIGPLQNIGFVLHNCKGIAYPAITNISCFVKVFTKRVLIIKITLFEHGICVEIDLDFYLSVFDIMFICWCVNREVILYFQKLISKWKWRLSFDPHLFYCFFMSWHERFKLIKLI